MQPVAYKGKDRQQELFRLVGQGSISAVDALQGIAPDTTSGNRQQRQDLEKELASLVGLRRVKELILELQAFVQIQQQRKAQMLASEPTVLHMIFKGNPGTGKTTVARIVGRMLNQLSVLSSGHLLEVERADLVAQYIGQTAQKTRQQIKKSMGGILFIDEAYALARGNEKDFGREAIDTLVKSLEDLRTDFIVILAGYHKPMERFLQSNPGLRSRFPIQISFPDFTDAELLKIAEGMVSQRQYVLSGGAKGKLRQMLEAQKQREMPVFGNARVARNLVERAIRRQAVRLIEKEAPSRQDLMSLTTADLLEVEDE